jgi:hypothetical protein
VALPRRDRKARRQKRRSTAAGVDHGAGLERPLPRLDATAEDRDGLDAVAAPLLATARSSSQRGIHRIEHPVARHPQAPASPGAATLGARQLVAESSSTSTPLPVEGGLLPDVPALFLVGRDPERSGLLVLARPRHLRSHLDPEPAGELGQGELRLGVVHDDEVSHRRRGRTGAGEAGLQDFDRETGGRERVRAGRPDDSRADDEDVRRRRILRTEGRSEGSRGSKYRVARPVTKARPWMRDQSWPSRSSSHPVKRASGDRLLPVAATGGSSSGMESGHLREVPVPQGERS